MARLTHADRIKMEALLNAGHSVQEVADQLHVHRATVYREYKRGKYMHRNILKKNGIVVIWDKKRMTGM